MKCFAFGVVFLGMALAIPVGAATLTSVRDLIYQYAVQGNVAQLQRLKKLGYSLDALDEHENTAYCQAIWMQQRRAISTLRAAGADRRPECLKKIPVVTVDMILDAAEAGDLNQLVAWKKADVQVDVVDSDDGNSALCKAVYAQNCKAIQTLLRAGAQETQTCMRKIPQSVRDQLNCKPVEINWDLVGYTTLGIATAGGVAALLAGSGGGGGSPVCSAKQRWQDDMCVSCATCWLGDTCIDADTMKSEYYYADETDASCWQVAPAPISYSDNEEFEGAVSSLREKTAYQSNGGGYDAVNLAYAHARGYTGYIVERSDNYGRLTNGQTPYAGADTDTSEVISNKKIRVAVMSSGTTIGNGGYKIVTNTSTDEGSSSTTTDRLSVWDWTNVNPHFYETSQVTTGQSYNISDTEVVNERTISAVKENDAETLGLGVADTSFALGSNGQPYGRNYDFGPCPSSGDKENCWGTEEVDGKDVLIYYGKDGKAYYLLANKKTGQPIGYDKNQPKEEDPYALVASNTKYVYPIDYVYNEYDPSPHYTFQDGTAEDSTRKEAGTRLASIIAALNQGTLQLSEDESMENNLYGVAFNAEVLPVIPDVRYVLPSVSNVVDQGPDVILNELLLASVIPSATATGLSDAVGTFTASGTIYKPGTVKNNFGQNTLDAFNKLASDTGTSKNNNSIVYVIPSGSSAINNATSMTHRQPAIDAAIPLLNEFNTSKTAWNSTSTANGALPVLDDTNKFKNRFIVVSSISSYTVSGGEITGGTLAMQAQPCGIAASYCVVAPGDLVGAALGATTSLTQRSGDGSSNLTSNAAAVVAGAVSLLQGAYPHLTSQEVVEILFKTAHYLSPTDIQKAAYNSASYTEGSTTIAGVGVYQETKDEDGNGLYNSIFGRGLIDLDAATSPVGGKEGLWVHKSGSAVTTYAVSTSLLSPSTMAVKLSSSLPTTFTAFDMYDRSFTLPTSMLFKTTDKRRAKSLSDFKAFMAGRDEIKAQPSENFSMSYLARTSTESSPIAAGLIKMQAKLGKATFGMFYSENTQKSFGSYLTRKLNNPFIQMREAYGLNTGWQFNSKWSVDASWISGKNGFFDEDAMDKGFDLPDNQMQAFTTSVTYRPVRSLGVKLASGVMRENNSSLGMVSSGAFDIKGAKTYFVGAGLTFNPVDNLHFDAMYYYGQTTTQQGDGLISLGKMMSDGFALTAEYNHSDNSTLGFQLSSPLRVKSGTLNVSLPVGRHPTEDIFYYDTYGVDMSPTARELDFSLYLKEQLRPDVLWQTELGTRLHPDHRSDAAPDYRAFMSVQWAY